MYRYRYICTGTGTGIGTGIGMAITLSGYIHTNCHYGWYNSSVFT